MAKKAKKPKAPPALTKSERKQLSDILAKARAIKAFKNQEDPTTRCAPLKRLADDANKRVSDFAARGLDLSKPTNQNTFKVISEAAAKANQAFFECINAK